MQLHINFTPAHSDIKFGDNPIHPIRTMTKRPACEALPEPVASKRPRIDEGPDSAQAPRLTNLRPCIDTHSLPPREAQPKSRKRPAPQDDGVQDLDASYRGPKKARIDNSPADSDDRERSPSPWLSIDDHPQHQHPADRIPWEWEQQVHEAVDRSEGAFRQARKDYVRFRRNRLPSPAPSDDESVIYDSEADEFGYTPPMLNLDNDDPEVEEVFGAAYAGRLRLRAKNRPTAPPVRPQQTLTKHDARSKRRTKAKVAAMVHDITNEVCEAISPAAVPQAGHSPRSNSSVNKHPSRRSRKVGTRNRRQRLATPQPSQESATSEGSKIVESVDEEMPLARRPTRQSRQQSFYELDQRGRARLVT